MARPGWTKDDLFPVIGRVIRELSPEGSVYVTRDEIALALVSDPEGRGLVEGGSGAWGLEATAGNAVDWFSADFRGTDWSGQFERERRRSPSPWTDKTREVWAYRPRARG